MTREARALGLLTLLGLVGCGEAGYDLYAREAETAQPPATGAAAGSNDAPAMSSCKAERDADLPVVRLTSTQSGLCVIMGRPILLMNNPGFEVTLSPCAEETTHYWTVVGLTDGGWELRNEFSGFNLDIRYASTDDGTPAVLYEPHLLYNQRFYLTPAPGNSFRITPQNAEDKCLEVRDNGLELWPCADANAAQLFEQLTCADALE